MQTTGSFSLSRWWLLACGMLYAGFFVFFSWPLALSGASALTAEPHSDVSVYLWNAWNFRAQVVAGHSPMHTTLLLYPGGTSLWLHTYTQVLGLLNLPLNQPFYALNLGLLLSFVLSGVGAAWLAGRWVRQPLLCALAGFAFAYTPMKLAHWSSHYNLVLTATVPFYVAAYLHAFTLGEGHRWPRLRSGRSLAALAALLLLTLLSDYYVLAGLLYFSAAYAGWWGLRLYRLDWRRWPAWAGLVAVLAAGHFASRGMGLLGFDDNAGLWFGGDLGGYLVPPQLSRWLGSEASRAFWSSPRLPVHSSPENVVFLGYLLPLVLLASLWARRPAEGTPARVAAAGPTPAGPAASGFHLPPLPHLLRPMPALVLFFIVLTMPELRWHGHDLFRLPTSLVHYVPFFNNIRCPTRLVLLAGLLLPLLAAVALDQWLLRRPVAGRWAVPALALALVFVEYTLRPYPLLRTSDVPQAYRAAQAAATPVLFPVPMGLMDGSHLVGTFDPQQLFYQTQHGKALRGGYLSRVPAATFAAFAQEPVLRTLLLAQRRPDSLALVPGPTPAELAAFGRRYHRPAFVVEPAYVNQPVHRLLRQWLLPAGYHEQAFTEPGGQYVLLRAD